MHNKFLLKDYTKQNFEYLVLLGYVLSAENRKDFYKISNCEYKPGEFAFWIKKKLKLVKP